MNPSYDNFCFKLNKIQPKNIILFKATVKAKEWEEINTDEFPKTIKNISKLYKQKVYIKGLRKTDEVEPVITYPEKHEDVNNRSKKYWFNDIVCMSEPSANEIIVYSKAVTTVPIEIMLICMRD